MTVLVGREHILRNSHPIQKVSEYDQKIPKSHTITEDSVVINRATPAVYMLCVEITYRVQDSQLLLPFLLLYTRRTGQIPLLLGQFNQLGEFIVGIIDKCYFVRIKDKTNKEMLLGKM